MGARLRRKKARTKAREVLVTKALLLGYTFELFELGGYMVNLPNGEPMHDPNRRHTGAWTYPARHVAAKAALKHAGVIQDVRDTEPSPNERASGSEDR